MSMVWDVKIIQVAVVPEALVALLRALRHVLWCEAQPQLRDLQPRGCTCLGWPGTVAGVLTGAVVLGLFLLV